MARRSRTHIERAAQAKRESKNLDFKDRFDPSNKGEWLELLKDFVAMANSGGGVVVVGVRNNGSPSGADVSAVLELDPATIADKVHQYTGEHFGDVEISEITRKKKSAAVIEVGPVVDAPLAFTRVGTYQVEGSKHQKAAFSSGTVYFRHGAKSEPGTSADFRQFIGRQLERIREDWLGGIRRVVEAPVGAQVAMIEATATDPEGRPTEIRLTDDPRAPTFGKLAPDRTHPWRQKELIQEVTRRLPGRAAVNAHDILSVRRVYDISEATHPEFTHKPKWASPQYSEAFADWLVQEWQRDSHFFETAKARYGSRS